MVVRAGALLRIASPAFRVVLGKVDGINDDEALGESESCFHRVRQALAHSFTDNETVDDDFDGVAEFLLQDRSVFEAEHFPVDDRARET